MSKITTLMFMSKLTTLMFMSKIKPREATRSQSLKYDLSRSGCGSPWIELLFNMICPGRSVDPHGLSYYSMWSNAFSQTQTSKTFYPPPPPPSSTLPPSAHQPHPSSGSSSPQR